MARSRPCAAADARPSWAPAGRTQIGFDGDGGSGGGGLLGVGRAGGRLGAPQSLTITNSGHGNLEIDAARVASGDVDHFLISHDTCSQSTLTIGETCRVRVRFGARASASHGADLRSARRSAHRGELPHGPDTFVTTSAEGGALPRSCGDLLELVGELVPRAQAELAMRVAEAVVAVRAGGGARFPVGVVGLSVNRYRDVSGERLPVSAVAQCQRVAAGLDATGCAEHQPPTA